MNSEDRRGAIWQTVDKDGIKRRDTQIRVGMKDAVLPRALASVRFSAASPVLTFSGTTPVRPRGALITRSQSFASTRRIINMYSNGHRNRPSSSIIGALSKMIKAN